jgi:hypothetical protein
VYGLYGDEWLPCSVSWWSSVAAANFANPRFLNEQNIKFACIFIEYCVGFKI